MAGNPRTNAEEPQNQRPSVNGQGRSREAAGDAPTSSSKTSDRPSEDPASKTPGLARVRAVTTAAIAGAGFGLIIVLTIVSLRNRDRLPELTPDGFYAAQRLWSEAGPSSYDVTVEVLGRQAATYHVEVREKQVRLATRNGSPLKQQRTLGTWSVPGMFGTMQSDVDNLESHLAGTADATTPQVRLHARFDPQFGYPARYHRTELSRWKANQEVSWEVTSFVVRD